MRRFAIPSVLRIYLLRAVRLVTKNVRGSPVEFADLEGRKGFAITGAKAPLLFCLRYGTTEVVP
jgi:hypothetical protein